MWSIWGKGDFCVLATEICFIKINRQLTIVFSHVLSRHNLWRCAKIRANSIFIGRLKTTRAVYLLRNWYIER